MKTLAIVALAVSLAACGSSPSAPSPAAIPQFQGVWTGAWARQQCSETGGAVGVGCNSLPLSGGLQLTATQAGSSVQGTLTLGSTQVAVSGPISTDGSLRLGGQGRQAAAAFNVTSWQSSVSGTALNGSFAVTIIPDDTRLGSVTFTAALQGVTKTS